MITETISYKNFNGEDDSRSMNFHISEAVLMENMTMRDRIAVLSEILSGPVRQLGMADIQEIVDLVKWLMSLAYGVKSVDGSTFEQDDPVGTGPIWRAFKSTAAYDAFLMSLFKEPQKAVQFIVNVLPAELRAQAQAEASPEMLAAMEIAKDASRLAPGTRIVNDIPQETARPLSVVPEQAPAPTDDEPAPDFDAMMARASGKSPISQQQHDYMRSKLSDKQFEQFMSTRELVTEE